MTGESNRTLYVGNLDPTVTEELIRMLFSQLGEILSCKMFHEANADPYCFIEYGDRTSALNAITMMNDKMLQTRKMRVDWATGQANKSKTSKVDTTKHFHVYVGELSPEIDEEALREAFKVFGEISDCKVVKDPQTFKSRGYGFVVFVKKYDAEVSIQSMNGQWLGRKMIKARWATRKLSSISSPETKSEQNNLDYDEVFNQTTGTNTTVFCGGLKQDISEEALQQNFHSFGSIDKIKIFKEKGFAFIKYTCKEHACQAIVAKHNSVLNGQTIRCSWGKDTGPEGQPQHPTATSPSILDHPSVVATPIPGAPVAAGQPMPVSPAAVAAAAYCNVAAVSGVPLGMQQMAAAVAGPPIVGTTMGHFPSQMVHNPQLTQHVQGSPISPAAIAATAPSANGQVAGYWQYYSQQAAAAAAVQQQMMVAAAANGSHSQVAPSAMAYHAPPGVTVSTGSYIPQYYSPAAAVPTSPVSHPYQTAGTAVAPPPGYMWMYPGYSASAPVIHQ